MSALKICPQCGTEYELDQRFCPKDGSTLKLQGGTTGDLVGSIIADRYSVLKKLGEGGMGTVYLAEHVKMGRKSAVKVMNPGMVNDADAISRFNREAANASRINHPNVAAVYDFGETSDGLIYLAMEFVEGPSLTAVIEQLGALPPGRAADITRQAGEALAVAHDMGIVHRDLKPDNIMIAKNRDGSDVVKVVDFGIAKAANNDAQKVTKTGLVVGTPEYMSPEQLAGDKLDGRSDTYSLALVAFAMLTGKLPFPAETVQESMIARLTDRPRTLTEMRAEVAWPADVQAVMDRALDRDAAGRYQTASEFGRELFRTVQTMPPAARASGATAVIEAPSAASRTAAAPAPAAAPATRPIPATRVASATPGQASPAVPTPPARSRMPMIAAVAAIVVIGGSLGAWKMLGGSGTGSAPSAAQQGDTATRGAPVASPNPRQQISRELAIADSLADVTFATPAMARQALVKLDSLAAVVPTDSDRVRVLLRKVQAHFILADAAPTGSAEGAREKKLGCDIIKDNEGKAAAFKNWNNNFQFFLHGNEQLPAQCK